MEAYMKGVAFLSKIVRKRGKGTVLKNLRFLSPTLGLMVTRNLRKLTTLFVSGD